MIQLLKDTRLILHSFRVATGLEDVSKYPILFDKLAETNENRIGWNRDELQNLASRNLIRVMQGVETRRDAIKEESVSKNLLPTH